MDSIDTPNDQMQYDEIASVCESRAANYALLSQLYRLEVTKELLDQLASMRIPANTGNAKLDKGYKGLVSYLGAMTENTITDLAVDYSHVFIGHGIDAYSAAYPYESVYTSEKRLLMQAARDEVLAIYRSQYLDKDKNWRESEDHLAVELEFMQIMATKTAETLSGGNEDAALAHLAVQLNFLRDHLLTWVPALTSDMIKFARTDFYKSIALITEGFLDTDLQFLTEITGEEEAVADALAQTPA